MTLDKIPYRFFLWTVVLATASACGDSDDDGSPALDSETPVSTDDTAPVSAGDSESESEYQEITASCDDVIIDGAVTLTDATNYRFDSTIEVTDTTVKSPADLTFDWGGVTTDIFGDTLDPARDINMVIVGLFGMTPDELADNIRNDNLPLSANKGAIAFYPPEGTQYTAQTLYNFTTPDGSAMPYDDLMRYFDAAAADYSYPQDTHTFMFIAATGTDIGKNSRMLGFFHLDPLATETTVALTDSSMKLDYDTNLSQIMPVPVPAGTAALNVSWEYMTVNALGNEFVLTQITEVMIGHYVDFTRPQLDDRFLDLREIAADTWSGEVRSGISIDLSTLVNDVTGEAFSGVDDTGVWVMALFCTKTCSNPAPWSITILQACGQ